MRLLIASDIHGSLSAARALAAKAELLQPDMVLFLGDILYHGPRNPLPDNYKPSEVATLLASLPTPAAAVRGNCDSEVDQMVLPFHLAESSWLFDGGRRIMAIHGHQMDFNGGPLKSPEKAAVLSGHTHVPTATKKDSTHFWNPGSTSLPKQNFPPSFGLYEEGLFQVVSFDGQILMADGL